MEKLHLGRFLYIFLIISIFSSCASILNKKVQQVNIHSQHTYTVFQGAQKLNIDPDTSTISILRSKNKLHINVLVRDSLHSVLVKPHISYLSLLNFIPSATGVFGFVVDAISDKSRDYPKNIYLYYAKNRVYFLPFNKELLDLKNNLKITTLRLFDPAAPTIEANFERKINDKFTTQLMLGTVFNLDMYSDFNDKINKISGHRKGIEIKYYLKKTAPIGPYLSIGYQNLSTQLNTIMRFEKSEIDSSLIYQPSYSDSIKVTRKINAINLKFGYQIIRQKFVYDMFIGTGIRHRNVSHSERLFTDDLLAISRHGSVFEFVNQEGKRFTGSLSLNLKIGYAF